MPSSDAATTLPRFKTEEGRRRYFAAYDAALSAWPVPFEEVDIQTSLGRTHIIASGRNDAPPLILLPSFAATGLVWRSNVAALSQRFRCYAVDVIGQPGRSTAVREIADASEYVAWLGELMNGLGVFRAPLVGCSFGAFIAALTALQAPDRVERLALIAPPGVFAAMSWRVAFLMRSGRLRHRLRRLLGQRQPSVGAALHARAAPTHPEDEPWRRLMATTMAEAPVLSVTDTRVFNREELARITAPTLLLIGEFERLYEPRETLRRARSLKPNLEAALVPGADHIAAMAQPNWVNDRLSAFLDAGGLHP